MWSFYGRKSKVVAYYPPPVFDTIIEPFAGTAVYSLYQNNWQKRIVLMDMDKVIVDIWHYLQQCSSTDILKLPDIGNRENLSLHTELIPVERHLIYFCANRGSARPYKWTGDYNDWNRKKLIIANDLYKIRHWEINQGDYQQVINQEATWFIDPPYQSGGHRYQFSNKLIDYNSLAAWVKQRQGQIIVCENTEADWLPFIPLKSMTGSKHTTIEAIWTREE